MRSRPRYHKTQSRPKSRQKRSNQSAGLRPAPVKARINQTATVAAAVAAGASIASRLAVGLK